MSVLVSGPCWYGPHPFTNPQDQHPVKLRLHQRAKFIIWGRFLLRTGRDEKIELPPREKKSQSPNRREFPSTSWKEPIELYLKGSSHKTEQKQQPADWASTQTKTMESKTLPASFWPSHFNSRFCALGSTKTFPTVKSGAKSLLIHLLRWGITQGQERKKPALIPHTHTHLWHCAVKKKHRNGINPNKL